MKKLLLLAVCGIFIFGFSKAFADDPRYDSKASDESMVKILKSLPDAKRGEFAQALIDINLYATNPNESLNNKTADQIIKEAKEQKKKAYELAANPSAGEPRIDMTNQDTQKASDKAIKASLSKEKYEKFSTAAQTIWAVVENVYVSRAANAKTIEEGNAVRAAMMADFKALVDKKTADQIILLSIEFYKDGLAGKTYKQIVDSHK